MTPILPSVVAELPERDPQPTTHPPLPPLPRKPAQARLRHPVLGEGLFKDALVRERRRADRFGAPFAVLIVDRSDTVSEAATSVSIARAIGAVKRESDAVGWLEQGVVLGVLLPEVTRAGALRVLDRLRGEVSG